MEFLISLRNLKMDMKIKSELVKELRNRKSWSQEHLASVSGLSLRTIQRIENSGVCSLDSQKALASVFDLEVAELKLELIENESISYHSHLYGYYGAGFGLVCAYAGISFSLLNNYISHSSAGLYYGATAAFCGLCCGVIGHFSKYKKVSQSV